jgi:hypothetical protein
MERSGGQTNLHAPPVGPFADHEVLARATAHKLYCSGAHKAGRAWVRLVIPGTPTQVILLESHEEEDTRLTETARPQA